MSQEKYIGMDVQAFGPLTIPFRPFVTRLLRRCSYRLDSLRAISLGRSEIDFLYFLYAKALRAGSSSAR
jgi:hypothetical protein